MKIDHLADCSLKELEELIINASVQYLAKRNAIRAKVEADIEALGCDKMDIEVDMRLNIFKNKI